MTKNTLCFVAEGFAIGTTVALGDLPDHVFPILLLLQLQLLLHVLHLLHLADHRVQGVELNEADLASGPPAPGPVVSVTPFLQTLRYRLQLNRWWKGSTLEKRDD